MFCTRCGTQAQAEARFCASCGTSLTRPVTSAEAPSAERVRVPPPVPAPAPIVQAAGIPERKSPVVALLLNLLLPGLGRAYAGNVKDGVWNFVGVVCAYFLWVPAAVFLYFLAAIAAYAIVYRENARIPA